MSDFKTYGDVLKKRNELNISRAKLSEITGIPVRTIETGEHRNSALTAENSALFEGAFKTIELDGIIDKKEKKEAKKRKQNYSQQKDKLSFVNENEVTYKTMKERIKNLEYTVELQKEQIKMLTERNKELEADKIKSNNKPKHTARTV